MNTRVLKPRHGPTLLVRPLRNGDIDAVLAVFHRLGEQSRRKRFNGPKARLTEDELFQLAVVDSTHHVLIGYVKGVPIPSRSRVSYATAAAAEIAFEVAKMSTSSAESARPSPRSCWQTRELPASPR